MFWNLHLTGIVSTFLFHMFLGCSSKFSSISSTDPRCFLQFVVLTKETLHVNVGWIGRFKLQEKSGLFSLPFGITFNFPVVSPVAYFLLVVIQMVIWYYGQYGRYIMDLNKKVPAARSLRFEDRPINNSFM